MPFFLDIIHGCIRRIEQIIVLFDGLFQLGNTGLLYMVSFRYGIQLTRKNENPNELYDNQDAQGNACAC